MEIAAFIISVFSILLTGITIIWTMIDRSNRMLKYRICRYIYSFYARTYMIDKLPTSSDIFIKFKKIDNSKIQYLLIELSLENKILMVCTMSDDNFETSKWKPNVNIYRSSK